MEAMRILTSTLPCSGSGAATLPALDGVQPGDDGCLHGAQPALGVRLQPEESLGVPSKDRFLLLNGQSGTIDGALNHLARTGNIDFVRIVRGPSERGRAHLTNDVFKALIVALTSH
jgi:hypothetical protein